MDKPSIVSVISQYVQLRRAGKEYAGKCPFHADDTPSFSVNEEKGVFHCHGCNEGGDAITFVEKIAGVDFKTAVKALGIRGDCLPPPRRKSPHHDAAHLLAAWLNRQHLAIGALCREVSAQIAIADEIRDRELSLHLRREWALLANLHGDLQNPAFAAELWESRDAIEALTADVPPEPAPEFPAVTPIYEDYLRSLVQC